MWFEFALLAAILIVSCLERAFKRGRLVFLAFLVLATMCVMLSAHNFLILISVSAININLRDVRQDAINAAVAGYVMLSVVNWALIILIGLEPAEAGASARGGMSTAGADPFQGHFGAGGGGATGSSPPL